MIHAAKQICKEASSFKNCLLPSWELLFLYPCRFLLHLIDVWETARPQELTALLLQRVDSLFALHSRAKVYCLLPRLENCPFSIFGSKRSLPHYQPTALRDEQKCRSSTVVVETARVQVLGLSAGRRGDTSQERTRLVLLNSKQCGK